MSTLYVGSVWTEARTNEAVRLRGLGFSAIYIAVQLGSVTRSAVIGKLYRLGHKATSPGRQTSNHVLRPPPGPRAPRQPRVKRPPPQLVLVAPGNGVALASQPAAVRTWRSNALPGKHQCRYPIGDPAKPGFTFCDRVAGLRPDGTEMPYCGHHAEICLQPEKPSRRPRELERSLRRYLA